MSADANADRNRKRALAPKRRMTKSDRERAGAEQRIEQLRAEAAERARAEQ